MSNPAAYIETAALAALSGTGTFLRQSAEQATLSLNVADLPGIILYDYTTAQPGTNSRTETAAVTLYFADAVPGAGDDAAEHHAAVDRMNALKRRFLARLDASHLVDIAGLRATPFAAAYEAKLDGVGVQFTITVPAATMVAACITWGAPSPAP